MSKHTPGPWVASEIPGKDWSVYNSEGELVSARQSDADANLIAAAPDMLEALEALNAVVPELLGHKYNPRAIGAQRKAHAAIKKAKGEI